jgi:hypothetical protein
MQEEKQESRGNFSFGLFYLQEQPIVISVQICSHVPFFYAAALKMRAFCVEVIQLGLPQY